MTGVYRLTHGLFRTVANIRTPAVVFAELATWRTHGWIYGRSLTVVVRLAGPVGKPYMVSSPEHGALVQ